MNRGRHQFIRALGVGLCLAVAACAEPNPSATGTVLVFKHGKLVAQSETIAAILRDFEHDHPGVTVREEILPSSSDQQHQFYAINLESRQVGFDLLAVDMIWVQEFARAGWLQDVDHLIPEAERRAYFPAAMQAASFEHHLYAVPWYVDAGILFYRRDLLERYGLGPPRTWPELVRTARTILDGEQDQNLAGFVWQGKQYEGLVCTALELIWGHGGDLSNDHDGETEAALAFMRALLTEGVSPGSVATADEETTRHMFGAGRALFMRNWPYAWSLLQQEGSSVRGRIGMAPLPSFPGYPSISVLGGWMLAIPRRAAHAREAEELIRFLSDPRIQQRIALDAGYNPPRRSLYGEKSQLLRSQPWLAGLYPVLQAARPRPVTPYYLMLSQTWQPELSAVVVGAKQPRAALASIRRHASSILATEEQP